MQPNTQTFTRPLPLRSCQVPPQKLQTQRPKEGKCQKYVESETFFEDTESCNLLIT